MKGNYPDWQGKSLPDLLARLIHGDTTVIAFCQDVSNFDMHNQSFMLSFLSIKTNDYTITYLFVLL